MNLAQAILTYGVCWWLLFFMALPIGVRPLENPRPGENPAAPVNPNLWKKVAAVTVLAVFVTWGIDLLLHSGIVTLHS